jgi:prefoldin subunit 5
MKTTVTQKYEVEVTRKYQLYEQNISNLQRENDELKMRLQEFVVRFES